MALASATVTAVTAAANGRPGTVDLLRGLSKYPAAPYPEWYAPRVGDIVLMDFVDLQPVVLQPLTAGRHNVPSFPFTVTVTDAAPTSGYSQAATIYAQQGVLTNPNLVIVRSAPYTPPPPPAAPPAPAVVGASSAHSWDPVNGWRGDNARVYQGIYPGSPAGSGARGYWFYPGFAATKGHTITRLQMTVARPSSGGAAGSLPMHLFLHGYPSQPAGGTPGPWIAGPFDTASPRWGGTVTFDLPLSWAQQLQAGTALGVGIGSDNGGDYLYVYGPDENGASGLLTFTYSS